MTTIEHRFVKSVPDVLEDGVVYVSVEYATAIHKCCCGCGREVVTPFRPSKIKGWWLTFNGKTISLDPSIGNWSFECQSHYWIQNNEVVWARKWTKAEIEQGREEEIAIEKKGAPTTKPRRWYDFFFGRK